MKQGLQKGIAVAIALVLVAYFFSGTLFNGDGQEAAVGEWKEIINE